MEAYCRVEDGPDETDKIIATLEMLLDREDNKVVRCRCSKVIADPSTPHSSETSKCALQVRRCPLTTDLINATVTRHI